MSEKKYYKVNNKDIALDIIESKFSHTTDEGDEIDTDCQIISKETHFNSREEAIKIKEKEIKESMAILLEKMNELENAAAKLGSKRDRLYIELCKIQGVLHK